MCNQDGTLQLQRELEQRRELEQTQRSQEPLIGVHREAPAPVEEEQVQSTVQEQVLAENATVLDQQLAEMPPVAVVQTAPPVGVETEKQAKSRTKAQKKQEKEQKKLEEQRAKERARKKAQVAELRPQAMRYMEERYQAFINEEENQGITETRFATVTLEDSFVSYRNVILGEVQKESTARDLLGEMSTILHYVRLFEKAKEKSRLMMTVYYDILDDETVDPLLKQAVTNQYEKNLEDLDATQTQVMKLGSEFENKIKAELGVTGDLFSGNLKHYRQEPARQEFKDAVAEYQKEHPGVTTARAEAAVNETVLRQKRPVSLRNYEETRDEYRKGKDKEARSLIRTMETYNTLQYANEDIQKQYPGAPQITAERADQLVREYLGDMERNANLCLRIPNLDIMALILDSGRFKTQIETGTTQGVLDDTLRREFPRVMFGADIEQMQPEDYEIYGYLGSSSKVHDYMNTNGGPEPLGVAQYGDVIVTLRRDRMEERTTMSVGDSLTYRDYAQSTRLGDHSLSTVNGQSSFGVVKLAYDYAQRKAQDPGTPPPQPEDLVDDVSYTELQYHGGVSVGDIDTVTLIVGKEEQREPADCVAPEMKERLRAQGIRITVIKGGVEHVV